MHKKEVVIQALLAQKILPLYFHNDPDVSIGVLQALYAAGIRVVEYTDRGAAALSNFIALRTVVNESLPQMILGMGTIKAKTQAIDYIRAGADFIICPSMNLEVADEVHGSGLLWIPGCMTPTEIAAAEAAGASVVKLFPGNVFGFTYIPSIKDIFPNLQFIVTGGVEPEEANLRNWFEGGAAGVGLGSRLLKKDLLDNRDYRGIEEAASKTLRIVQGIIGKSTER